MGQAPARRQGLARPCAIKHEIRLGRARGQSTRSTVTRKAGIAPDLALRVYSTRLLGRDPKLVLHGGGNSSLKTQARDLAGDEVEVLCVKGSGADMGAIEPAGFPGGAA